MPKKEAIIIKLKNIYNHKKWEKKEKKETRQMKKYNFINKMIIKGRNFINDCPQLIQLFINYCFKILKSILIILILIKLDCCIKTLFFNKLSNIYLNISSFIKMDYNMVLTFILSCTGLAGVLLAMFYANFSGIFSSKYINQSKKISATILNESVNKKYLIFIQEYIIFTLLSSFAISFGIDVGHILILVILILTAKLIVTFVNLSHRVFGLSNLSNVVYDISRNILKAINAVSYDSYQYNNYNFQAHYKKTFYQNYSTLNNLLVNCIDSKDEETLLTIADASLYLLKEYSKIKNKIPFKSLWYDKKTLVNNWFTASDHEIIMAVSTGTTLSEKTEKDQFYFENKLFDIFFKIFDYFIKIRNYDELLNLINSYRDTVLELYNIMDFNNTNKFNDLIINKLKNIEILECDNKKIIFAIYDISSLLIVDNVLSSRKIYSDIPGLIDKFVNSEKTEEDLLKYNSRFLNNNNGYSLIEKLDYERKVEKKIITPNWYIRQYMLNYFYNSTVEIFKEFYSLYSKMLNLADFYFSKKEYTIANIYYSRGIELYNRIIYFFEQKDELFNDIIKTNDFNYLDFEEDLIYEKLEKEYIVNLESYGRSAGTDALIDKDEKYVDNIGHIYYELYNNLLNLIFKNDITSFKRIYPIYLATCKIGEQSIFKLVDENTNVDYRLNKYSQIMTQFMTLSGFAIYYSHLTNNPEWENYIKEKSEFLKNSNEKITEAERCLACAEIRNNSFNVSIFESNCQIKINDFIRKSGLIEYKDVGMFGNKIINNKDILLRKFKFDERMGFYGKLYDIYMVNIVNGYLPKDKKYKSQSKWEDKKYED